MLQDLESLLENWDNLSCEALHDLCEWFKQMDILTEETSSVKSELDVQYNELTQKVSVTNSYLFNICCRCGLNLCTDLLLAVTCLPYRVQNTLHICIMYILQCILYYTKVT